MAEAREGDSDSPISHGTMRAHKNHPKCIVMRGRNQLT